MSEQTSGLGILELAKRQSAVWNFFSQPRLKKLDSPEQDEKTLGYVETGAETIQLLVECIRDGRHAILVGPRGTGKSYMGAQAVRQARDGGELGVIQTIEIQGDPNKPPSDYFDDTISFCEFQGRLSPSMINAPFFDLAERDPKTNKFKCGEDDNRIILRKRSGEEIDRVVLYWDEGNRSSPAMLNAVLGLLAEGRLRRDGIAYTFPPVSCILTRNPDGYDANSAKMPSPLIDRFGLQFYVYNPTMYTFVGIIAPEYLHRQRLSLLREAVTAFSRHDKVKDSIKKKLNELLKNVNAGHFKTDDSLAKEIRKLDIEVRESGLEVVINQYPINATQKDAAFVQKSWQRVMNVPDNSLEYRRIAARLAVVVLATWGDCRDTEAKPGMQYLPPAAKDVLRALAKLNSSVGAHLQEVGNLTRYGTSIRAFEEWLKALLVPILAGTKPGDDPMRLNLDAVRKNLGALLGHRCESTFNPDREPAKAMRKNKSLHWLANWILDDAQANAILEVVRLDKVLAESKIIDQ